MHNIIPKQGKASNVGAELKTGEAVLGSAVLIINVVQLIPAGKRLSMAVRAAISAYEKTGHMLDAALAYAAHGFPVFPLTSRKTPVPPRDEDPSGKFKDGIPGTGSFKKATTDPDQIHTWWDEHEYLIGLPMGAASRVWCTDVDTSEDHVDGVAEWEK